LEPEFGDAFVYANGEIVLERLGPTDEIREILQIWVGSAIDGGNFMDGRLDDFLIDDEALSQAQIIDLVDNGVRSVYPNIPAEPEEYVPTAPEGRLVNMNGKLAGAAFLDGAEIDSWRVEQIFHAMAGGMDVEAVADLSSAGVTGMGNVGDASTDVQLGDVDLVNTGADDETLEFRLVTTHSDPVLGPGAETVFSQTFDLAGSGGGTDPFVFLGDLDQDGMVQFSDFVIMAENFGAVKPPAGAPEVPEPSSSLLMLLAAGLLAPVVRRRSA
jgi:hypothetical protein